MSVVVVTDTTASVDPRLATEWGIRLVPLTVTVAGRSYWDDEIDVSTLAGARVTTAGPPPGDFLAALQDAPAGAVVVTVAGSLSSENAAARVTTVRRLRKDPRVPRGARIAIVVAGLWVASPIDLIPEFLPVIGPLDDVIVVALALRYAGRQVPREVLMAPGRASDTFSNGCSAPPGSTNPAR